MNNLRRKPSDNELLRIYGLFKQAKVGNVNTCKYHLNENKQILDVSTEIALMFFK